MKTNGVELMKIRIAFLQILPGKDIKENLAIGKKACVEAKEKGADIALFPEIATCNYPDGQPDCNGRSTLFDGVPWLRDEPGVRDMCVMEAPKAPGVYIAELDLDMLRTHRSNDIMGDTYRRPEAYGIFSDVNVKGIIGGDFVHW